MSKNIAAWTGPTPREPSRYAEFVSINVDTHPTERRVAVTVRNSLSEVVEVSMTREAFAMMLHDAQKFMLENP